MYAFIPSIEMKKREREGELMEQLNDDINTSTATKMTITTNDNERTKRKKLWQIKTDDED